MKVEDSGMPDEAYWNSLFDIEGIVDWLDLENRKAAIAEIGCGYGSFTVPVAKKTSGNVFAFDIDASMLKVAQEHVRNAGLANVRFCLRDVLEQGTGLEAESAEMVLLFNILHSAERGVFLAEASRVLKPGGVVAIIHWRKDIPTPRGPAVALRPDQEQIISAAEGLKLKFAGNSRNLGPYHWGMQLVKTRP
ncbi:MAG TPA: class I SAM-dependent methyltransferase [Gallionellaceae bacterium]|nr:class I SAM-dependent methyltransferase [Gallionellaceae bacterium]